MARYKPKKTITLPLANYVLLDTIVLKHIIGTSLMAEDGLKKAVKRVGEERK